MTDREELARDIATSLEYTDSVAGIVHATSLKRVDILGAFDLLGVAESLIAEGYRKPRTITTVEELDELPAGAVVLDALKSARTKRWADTHMPGGCTSGGRMPISSKDLADGNPMTVLFDPMEAS